MRFRAPFFLAPWLALLLSILACTKAPITGRDQLLLLSEEQEVQMGLQSFLQVKKKNADKISRNPYINEQVRRVGRRIAQATGKNYKWEFIVIESNQPNAFVLPGGKVTVYTGILPITLNDHGLATVLGHEVAHAIARHGGERVSQNILVQTSLAAVQIGMESSGSSMSREVTAALGAGASVGILLPYARTQESEADRLGLIYMAKAGYDPRRAVNFWRRMIAAAQKSGGNRPPEWLSTHPGGERRIRQIQAWLPEALRYYRPR
jgi:predicted Zn-dependent protease